MSFGCQSVASFAAGNPAHVSAAINRPKPLSFAGVLVDITNVALSGAEAANYSLASLLTATGRITPRPITARFAAQGPVIQGAGSVALLGQSDDLLAGDRVSITAVGRLLESGVGPGRRVGVTRITLQGPEGGNYKVNLGLEAVAEVLPAPSGDRVIDGGAVRSLLRQEASSSCLGDDPLGTRLARCLAGAVASGSR